MHYYFHCLNFTWKYYSLSLNGLKIKSISSKVTLKYFKFITACNKGLLLFHRLCFGWDSNIVNAQMSAQWSKCCLQEAASESAVDIQFILFIQASKTWLIPPKTDT